MTESILEVDVTPEHQGAVFICEARNPRLRQSVHDAKTLSVKCEEMREGEQVAGTSILVGACRTGWCDQIVAFLTPPYNPIIPKSVE